MERGSTGWLTYVSNRRSPSQDEIPPVYVDMDATDAFDSDHVGSGLKEDLGVAGAWKSAVSPYPTRARAQCRLTVSVRP